MPAEPVIQEVTVKPGQYTVTATLSSTDVTVLPTIQEVNIRAGIRGPAGPAGEPGEAGANGSNVVWLGEWEAGEYDALEGVQYEGSAWVANKTTTATPPSTPAGTSADWDLFVAKGEKGDKGDKGDTGDAGPKGDKGDTGNAGAEGAGYLKSGNTEFNEEPNVGTFVFTEATAGAWGAYVVGARARAINTEDADSWVEGPITNITGSTLTLVADSFQGATAGSLWALSIAGERGIDGTDGNDGWTPELAVVSDGERRVQQVVDWFGGEGTKPATGKYVGATGLVAMIGDGVDIRGPVGSGSGDVSGPASSTTGNFAVFADTTGKEIADGGTPGDGATADFGSTAGTICEGNDARLSDARTPTAHASSHVTSGSDKIRDATASQDGLMTAAYAAKLDGIAAGANAGITQLTGDVTAGPGNGSQAATIASDSVTNAKLANMAAWTVKVRNNAASGDPQDVVATDLTEETTPAAGDFLLGWESGGALRKFDVGDLPGGGGGSDPTFAEVASDVAITDNANFQNITGLSFSVAANTKYRIDFVLSVTTSAGATGYEVGLTGPASPTRILADVSILSAQSAFVSTLTNGTSYGSIAANLNGPGATPRVCRGTIFFTNGANAGTLQLQGKVETSISGTVTFQAGSAATITELA